MSDRLFVLFILTICGKHIVLDIPKLLRKVNIVVVRIGESSDLIPHALYFSFAVSLDLFDGGQLIDKLTGLVYLYLQFFCGEVLKHLAFPCVLRIKELYGLCIIYSFVVNAKQIGFSFTGLIVAIVIGAAVVLLVLLAIPKKPRGNR